MRCHNFCVAPFHSAAKICANASKHIHFSNKDKGNKQITIEVKRIMIIVSYDLALADFFTSSW